jgi:hypothetical protein
MESVPAAGSGQVTTPAALITRSASFAGLVLRRSVSVGEESSMVTVSG